MSSGKIEVIDGYLEKGEWTFYGPNYIRLTGLFFYKAIPISSIKEVIKKEEIKSGILKKDVYFDVTLTNDKKFTAKSNEKTFNKIYQAQFISPKANATVEDKPNTFVIGIAAFMALLILTPMMCSEKKPAEIKNTDTTNVEPTKSGSSNEQGIAILQPEKICKAGIATVMGRDPSIINTTNTNGSNIGLSYTRENDGTKWSFKCKIEGNVIIWGNSDGRWRTDPLDGVVTYTVANDSIEVSEKYTDGSETIKTYPLSSL